MTPSQVGASPQEEGRRRERRFCAEYGAKAVPGSGAMPRAKLDAAMSAILWSLKWTGAKSYRLTAADVREMVVGAEGPGSRGVLPALAVEIAGIGEDLSVLRTRDLIALLRGEVNVRVEPERRVVKRAYAEPRLLRES